MGRHVQADIYAHQNASNHYTTYNSHVEMDTKFSPGSAIPSSLSSPKALQPRKLIGFAGEFRPGFRLSPSIGERDEPNANSRVFRKSNINCLC